MQVKITLHKWFFGYFITKILHIVPLSKCNLGEHETILSKTLKTLTSPKALNSSACIDIDHNSCFIHGRSIRKTQRWFSGSILNQLPWEVSEAVTITSSNTFLRLSSERGWIRCVVLPRVKTNTLLHEGSSCKSLCFSREFWPPGRVGWHSYRLKHNVLWGPVRWLSVIRQR